MNTLHISGLLEQPKAIECSVRVLGDPRLSDPSVSENISELERLIAVSANGQWMALVRKGRGLRDKFYTISRTGEGTEEMVVPLKNEWEHTRARDIADEGTFLFEAELARSFSDCFFSRRPVVFTPGNKELVVLPPEYKEREWGADPLKDDRPRSHTPYCYAPDGAVFGWTHPNYDRRRDMESRETPHCIWRRKQSGEWTVEYTPDFMNSKWLWPAYTGTFVCCDQPDEDDTVRFGFFDGVVTTPYEDVSVDGHAIVVVSVAKNGTFLGHCCIRDGKKGKDKYGKPELSSYTFLIQPQTKAGHTFNDFDKNPWLHELSANGQYIIGSHPGAGHFLMKAEGDGYRYAALATKDWRVEDLVDVTDEGHVFAVATCTERKHGCFRLKLPVLLIPQW